MPRPDPLLLGSEPAVVCRFLDFSQPEKVTPGGSSSRGGAALTVLFALQLIVFLGALVPNAEPRVFVNQTRVSTTPERYCGFGDGGVNERPPCQDQGSREHPFARIAQQGCQKKHVPLSHFLATDFKIKWLVLGTKTGLGAFAEGSRFWDQMWRTRAQSWYPFWVPNMVPNLGTKCGHLLVIGRRVADSGS
jgi:hypothetical protein